MTIQEIPPITLQVTFDKMSPQIESFLYCLFILLITVLIYIYLIIIDLVVKRMLYFTRKNTQIFYSEVNNEIN